MQKINSYKDLVVWNLGIEIVMSVYSICKKLPEYERFGLISQMQRSAVSIPSNIAEGYGRASKNDYIRFVNISRGSIFELETQLIIVKKLYNIEEIGSLLELIDRVSRMTNVLLGKLKQSVALNSLS